MLNRIKTSYSSQNPSLVFQRTNTITRDITVVVTLHACCGTVNPAPYIITRIHAKKTFDLSIQVVLSSSTNEYNGKKHLQPRITDLVFKQSINHSIKRMIQA
jgi:hypothetical protein